MYKSEISNLTILVCIVLQELTEKKDVRHFWMRCVDAPLLYTSAERFLAQLEQSFGDKVRHRYDVPATKGWCFLTTQFSLISL